MDPAGDKPSAVRVVRSNRFHRSCLEWLQSNYATASPEAMVLTQDVLSNFNNHLRRTGETQLSPSEMGSLIKSAYGDAVQRKRHRFTESASEEATRAYAYVGLAPMVEDTVEPPAKLKHSDTSQTTMVTCATSAVNSDLETRIKELEAQLRSQADAKDKRIYELESKLTAETQVHQALQRRFETTTSLQWCTVREQFQQELDALYQDRGPFMDGPSTAELLQNFRLSLLDDQLANHATHLHSIVSSLDCPASDSAQHGHAIHKLQGIAALSILARRRSSKMKGLQLLVSLMMVARAASKQVIASFNHLGICLSYRQTMEWVRRLAREAATDIKVKEGLWVIVYDNVNFQKKICHERSFRHTESWNFTSRLAVKVSKLPPPDIACKEHKPQGSRSALYPELLLPSEKDEEDFIEQAQLATMQALTTHFAAFQHLQAEITDKRKDYQPVKSQIQPLALMDTDESIIDNNIEILLQSAKDLGWVGDKQQCVVGDQATCVTIRGAKRRRIDDSTPLQRLGWAQENPGDFHFLWECLRVIFLLFWGRIEEVGSLAHLKSLANRRKVDKEAKHFQQSDEFLNNVLESYLIASLTRFLGLENPQSSLQSGGGRPINLEWLQDKANEFVRQNVAVPRDTHKEDADQVFNRHRCFLHASLLYWDLRNAIRCEDGPAIIAQWRWWLVYFLASKRSNYSQEAANLLANLKANFSEQLAYIVTHNRTVNVSGIPGKGKPLDMAIEHHNLILKNALRSSGANVTQEHLKTISLASQYLQEAASLCDSEFHTPVDYGHHTVTDCKDDIVSMTKILLDHKITEKIEGRQVGSTTVFEPPFGTGWRIAVSQQWLQKFFKKTESIADFEADASEHHNDIESLEDISM